MYQQKCMRGSMSGLRFSSFGRPELTISRPRLHVFKNRQVYQTSALSLFKNDRLYNYTLADLQNVFAHSAHG